jgi:hypothetical protein
VCLACNVLRVTFPVLVRIGLPTHHSTPLEGLSVLQRQTHCASGEHSPIVRNVHKRQLRSGPKRKRGGLIILILSVSRLPFFRAFFFFVLRRPKIRSLYQTRKSELELLRYQHSGSQKVNWNFSCTNVRVPNEEKVPHQL